MEIEIPLVHHIVKRQGYGHTIKTNESLNENTRRHPKIKPKSKLVQVGWKQRKVLSQDGHGGLD
jgi:hypothetical protein